MKVVHRAQPGWGVGHVTAVSEDPPRLQCTFPGRADGPVLLSTRDKALVRWRFSNGAPAQLGDGAEAKVLRQLPGSEDDLYRYTVEVPGKKPAIRSEADLRAVAPRQGPAEQLASGRWGNPTDFALRNEVVRLDLERRADALGALFASRVYVKPHQVSVAHQVLSAAAPRFVLADEVGLGKTIEAGLVLSALLHAGLVRRCLVVAPSHLTVQWLGELFHKFNLLFTLMDPERAEGDRRAQGLEEAENASGQPQASPWARHKLVVTSLEWLSRAKEEADECAEAGWDLVIMDEAHHLRGERAYEVAQDLSAASWGLLLLTATPLQLDPAEYHALLRLVDPAPAATEAALRKRLARAGDLSTEVRALLGGEAKAATRIAALFPQDAELQPLAAVAAKNPNAVEDLLAHLADGYGLSARLLRNRRASVGGFTKRSLTTIAVALGPEERSLEAEVRAAVSKGRAAGTLPTGAVLSSLLRRLGSSPPALAAALSGTQDEGLRALAPKAAALAVDGRDAKLEAFRDLLFGELEHEKVLVFAEARETIDYLKAALARAPGKGSKARPVEALAYAGDLSPADRDKLVARFRDPDGPRVLLCTELGGEGRNFQHCHVLVNYDLPWSPAAVEQRIGRIDRIGQSREVRIVAFRPEGTLAARALDVLDQAVGVFTEPVGGLDAVLEQVEAELTVLGSQLPGKGEEAAWQQATAQVAARVSAARAEVARAYDPLLDRRSCDLSAVKALAERGARRLGVQQASVTKSKPASSRNLKAALEAGKSAPPALPGDEAAQRLSAVATALESRLERTTLQIALRIGLQADVDVDVLPGEVSFQVGPELKVDALAGFDLAQDRVVLGSFRREIAVAHEEHDSFATGHPLVEALFGWVRDGELGRASVYRASLRGQGGAALDGRWTVALPEAVDLARGARVPSRRAARFLEEGLVRVVVTLDGRGGAQPSESLAAQLDSADIEGVPAPDGGPPAPFVAAVEAALRVAQAEADKRLGRLVASARARVIAERTSTLKRLARFLSQSGVKEAEKERVLEEEAALYEQVLGALEGARLELDQAALVQLV